MWFRNNILVSFIKILFEYIKVEPSTICKKNLSSGDFNNFVSDNIPKKKINIQKINKLKYKYKTD